MRGGSGSVGPSTPRWRTAVGEAPRRRRCRAPTPALPLPHPATLPAITEPAPQVLHYSNEKAQLAQQIYDSVDAKIRRLDKDLAAFDAELAAERVAAGLPPGGLDALAPVDPDGGKGKRKSGGSRKRKGEADPAEPVYCYCQRVSFGDMVACDNPDCAIEWFHYECAGISPDAPPKGKWFCRECAAARAVAGGPGEGGV